MFLCRGSFLLGRGCPAILLASLVCGGPRSSAEEGRELPAGPFPALRGGGYSSTTTSDSNRSAGEDDALSLLAAVAGADYAGYRRPTRLYPYRTFYPTTDEAELLADETVSRLKQEEASSVERIVLLEDDSFHGRDHRPLRSTSEAASVVERQDTDEVERTIDDMASTASAAATTADPAAEQRSASVEPATSSTISRASTPIRPRLDDRLVSMIVPSRIPDADGVQSLCDLYSPEQTTRIINVPLLNGAVDTVVCTNIVVSDVPDPVHAPRLHGVEDGGLPVRTTWQISLGTIPLSCASRAVLKTGEWMRFANLDSQSNAHTTNKLDNLRQLATDLVDDAYESAKDAADAGLLKPFIKSSSASRTSSSLAAAREDQLLAYKRLLSSIFSKEDHRILSPTDHIATSAFLDLVGEILVYGCDLARPFPQTDFEKDLSDELSFRTVAAYMGWAEADIGASTTAPVRGCVPAADSRRLSLLPPPPRTYIFSDIHGDYEKFRALLLDMGVAVVPTIERLNEFKIFEQEQAVEVVAWDEEIYWTVYAKSLPAPSHLVVLGDVVDRGPYAFSIYTCLVELWRQADTLNIKVVVFLGNHDLNRMFGNARMVNRAPQELVEKEETDFLVWENYSYWLGDCSYRNADEEDAGVLRDERVTRGCGPLPLLAREAALLDRLNIEKNTGHPELDWMIKLEGDFADIEQPGIGRFDEEGVLTVWLYFNAAVIGIVGGSLLVHAGIPYSILGLQKDGNFFDGQTHPWFVEKFGKAREGGDFVTLADIMGGDYPDAAFRFLANAGGDPVPGSTDLQRETWEDAISKTQPTIEQQALARDIFDLVWVGRWDKKLLVFDLSAFSPETRSFWYPDKDALPPRVMASCAEVQSFLDALNTLRKVPENGGLIPVSRIVTGHTPIGRKGAVTGGLLTTRCQGRDSANVLGHNRLLFNVDVGQSKYYNFSWAGVPR